jgi:exopolyphosphatase/guanosine-5'-triphosphate,3'-diphosphate pyrophosphatase
LSPEQLARARALGAALRLGCDLSGRSPALLNAATLSQDRGELVLALKNTSTDMVLGEQTQKRAVQLATALGLTLKLKTR